MIAPSRHANVLPAPRRIPVPPPRSIADLKDRTLGAAVATLGRAPDLGAPGAAGAFALADGDRLARLLDAGGFHEVQLETVTRPVCLGRTVADAASFVMSLPESETLFTGAPNETVNAAVAALRAAFASYVGTQGVVLDATAWLVSARP